jgi:hypothetical protein
VGEDGGRRNVCFSGHRYFNELGLKKIRKNILDK